MEEINRELRTALSRLLSSTLSDPTVDEVAGEIAAAREEAAKTLLRILAPAGGKETVPSVTISTIPEACARLHRALGAFARVAAAVKLKPNEARAVKAAGALANLLNPLAKKGRHAAD